ncbi:MAG: hypothetical protein U5J98_08040 [Halobacteriales archaeon]|nr:hypothetical protein [Halobacteriales archaeon]
MISRDVEDVVVALMAIDRERGYAWLIGYDSEFEGWSLVDEWPEVGA